MSRTVNAPGPRSVNRKIYRMCVSESDCWRRKIGATPGGGLSVAGEPARQFGEMIYPLRRHSAADVLSPVDYEIRESETKPEAA
jgi:hypothetical protein